MNKQSNALPLAAMAGAFWATAAGLICWIVAGPFVVNAFAAVVCAIALLLMGFFLYMAAQRDIQR